MPTTDLDLRQRLIAGAVHLGASSLVALAVAALIFLVWYPAPLAGAQGVSRLLLILIAVDVTIGPLVTTLIYDRRKRSLKFDLAVVVVLQLGFLLYGVHAIFAGRPAVIVFNVDRFDVVQAQDVDRESLGRAVLAGKPDLPLLAPRVVFAELPDDRAQRDTLLFSAALGGPDLPQMAEWYEPYANGREAVLARVRPLSELQQSNRMDDAAWRGFIDSLGRPEQALGYLPLKAKVRDGAVVVDARTAEIVRIVLLEPRWRSLRAATSRPSD